MVRRELFALWFALILHVRVREGTVSAYIAHYSPEVSQDLPTIPRLSELAYRAWNLTPQALPRVQDGFLRPVSRRYVHLEVKISFMFLDMWSPFLQEPKKLPPWRHDNHDDLLVLQPRGAREHSSSSATIGCQARAELSQGGSTR